MQQKDPPHAPLNNGRHRKGLLWTKEGTDFEFRSNNRKQIFFFLIEEGAIFSLAKSRVRKSRQKHIVLRCASSRPQTFYKSWKEWPPKKCEENEMKIDTNTHTWWENVIKKLYISFPFLFHCQPWQNYENGLSITFLLTQVQTRANLRPEPLCVSLSRLVQI